MNKYDKQYKNIQLRVRVDIERIYGNLVDDIVLSLSVLSISEKEYFYFKNYPTLNKKVKTSVNRLSSQLLYYINNQSSTVWELSNTKNDVLTDRVFARKNKIAPTSLKQHNEKVLTKLQQQKIKGLTLSDRIWKTNADVRLELESAISAAINKGQSAKSLATDIKKYLNNPDARFRRVRDKFGNLKPSASALQYNPGQGVYRSSQANALRLAKETINRHYREADHLRWSQMPFVVGYKLRNSERKSTVCSICEKMNGMIFPKSHKFIGNHIGCLCTALPVMCSDEEFDKVLQDEKYSPLLPPIPKEYLELA